MNIFNLVFLKKQSTLYVLLLIFCTSVVFAKQGITVTGTVSDNIEPLPGVNVMVKGTTIGMTTDINGRYSITVPDANAVLVFSFVGYQTAEFLVGDRRIIDAVLVEASTQLDEVVVIGYGTQRKRDISTSISSVSRDDIKEQPVTGFDQAMAGKMAGVRVTSNNAAPGGGQQITIRGASTINGSTNAPLYVVDGFPLKDNYNQSDNPINFINPADIESIEVLKDASSSAIYGAMAASGVILITTKRGKTGKPTITVNASYGTSKMIRMPQMVNREEFLDYLQEGRNHAYIREDPNYWDDVRRSWNMNDPDDLKVYNWQNYSMQYRDPAVWAGGMYERWITVTDTVKNSPFWTNWMDEITQRGVIQEYQISASGGTDNVSYAVSIGYHDNKGIEKKAHYTRYTARANVDVKATENIKFGLNIAPSYEVTDKIWNTGSGGTGTMWYNALIAPPVRAARNEDGTPHYIGTIVGGPFDWNLELLINPLCFFERKDLRNRVRFLTGAYTEINIMKDLTFRTEINASLSALRNDRFTPSTFPTSEVPTTRSQGENETQQSFLWNSQNYLTYNKRFAEHSVTAMLGFSADEETYKRSFIRIYDYPMNMIPTLNQGTVVLNAVDDIRTEQSRQRMIGSYGRLMYNYAGKYYLTASVRRDGSSKFGPKQKWGVFPSFSVAWRISDEAFMSSLDFISDMKIRATMGQIGMSNIGNYQYIPTLGSQGYFLGQSANTLGAGYYPSRIPNDMLRWEKHQDYDIGLDLSLFNGRVGFEYDYYFRKINDILFNISLPWWTGFNTTRQNIGSMQNKGQEFTVRTRNFIGRDFKWNTNFNIYYNRNKVTDLGLSKTPLTETYNRTYEGRPLGTHWLYHVVGIYSDWEQLKSTPIWATSSTTPWTMPGLGMPIYEDINGDGFIDANDKTICGNAEPDFLYGIINTFQYKNFDLSIQINGRYGGDVFMPEWSQLCASGRSAINIPKWYYDNYWRPDRPNAKYMAPQRKENNGQSRNDSDAFLEKGTYLNIQNVVLGYNVPRSFSQKVAVQNARVYLSIQNLYMFTKYHGFNPDASDAGENPLAQGLDRGSTYPMSRTVSLGLSVSF